jgi:hypothetical protein
VDLPLVDDAADIDLLVEPSLVVLTVASRPGLPCCQTDSEPHLQRHRPAVATFVPLAYSHCALHRSAPHVGML